MTDKLRTELIQVAAVAIAAVTDLDTGSSNPHGTETEEGHHGKVMGDVTLERVRQERKWGSQHHTQLEWLMILLEEVGETAEEIPFEVTSNQDKLVAESFRQDTVRLGRRAKIWLENHEWPVRQQEVFDGVVRKEQ